MYRMLKSVAMQGTHLASLFVQLNFNNFYDQMHCWPTTLPT
jgi:hypothetical protein